jgi:hypothetical protein
MRTKTLVMTGITVLLVVAGAFFRNDASARATPGLAETIRDVTEAFRDVQAAKDAGYVPASPCVSGPQEGAMGFHYAKPELIGDGQVDATTPELLTYEQGPNGKLQLLGVEYLVLAADWDAGHDVPPSLGGQLFHFVGSPNRYRLPAFYELHVWAWRENPNGTFADFNTNVTCDHVH